MLNENKQTWIMLQITIGEVSKGKDIKFRVVEMVKCNYEMVLGFLYWIREKKLCLDWMAKCSTKIISPGEKNQWEKDYKRITFYI